MIVDCHVNIWDDIHLRPNFAAQLGRVRPSGTVGLKADADTIYQEMSGVDRAILFSVRYGDSAGVEGTDETTAQAVAKYPDKFVGFAYIDPRHPDCLELLRHSVEDLGLRGVKFGPIYNAVALDDPRLTPVYEYCIANDLPLTLHMGITYTAGAPADLGRPIHVDALALSHPELKIVMAHLGHPWCEECIVIVRKQPNVYADISAIFYRPWQFYNALICVQEYGAADKIFWGTDFPFAGVTESIAGLRGVNDPVAGTQLPRVSSETIERILHANPFEHWWHGEPPLQ